MNPIFSKDNSFISKQNDRYYLNVYDYLDDLKRNFVVNFNSAIILNRILCLLEILYPKGTSTEMPEEILKD